MRRLLVLTGGLLGGWGLAAAQVPPPPSAAPVVQETLVVTASLDPEPLAATSATVDVVDAATIERRQANEALDLLRDVPGLFLVQSGSPGKVASLFTRGTSSAQTLVLWNGVELNDPVLGAFDWSFVPTTGLERIEVVRGPASALYGSNAVGGVVQLLTRRRGRALSVRLEGGSDRFRRGELFAAGSAGGLHGAIFGAARDGEGTVPNDDYSARGGGATVDWQASASLLASLVGRFDRARIGIPFDFSGDATPEQRQTTELGSLALPIAWSRDAWQVDGRLASTRTTLEVADPSNPFAASRSRGRRDDARAVGTRHFGNDGWLAAGVEWQRERAKTDSAFGPGVDDRLAVTRALFAQGSWGRDAWRFDLGARRDEHDAFGGATSLKAGIVRALGAAARLRASYGESFRAPSLADLYYPGFGNPELEPERGRSAELAVEGERGALSWRLALFENDLRHLIQFDFVTFLPENIGRARIRGFETSAAWRGERFELAANSTWQDPIDRATGDLLPRRPRFYASLTAGLHAGDFDLALAGRRIGTREDVGGAPLAAATTVDLRVDFRGLARLRPFARIDNLLDREYQEAAGFPAPGRRWALGVGGSF
jgi:vitamin B12 transporter